VDVCNSKDVFFPASPGAGIVNFLGIKEPARHWDSKILGVKVPAQVLE